MDDPGVLQPPLVEMARLLQIAQIPSEERFSPHGTSRSGWERT
ncbi:hypothetical protein ACFWNT_19535 [Streptomyces sp. NPDC058409]